MTVCGIVLAAGAGTRFGGAKQLAQLEGRPLLEHALATMTTACERVVVVLGAHAEAIAAAVHLGDARPVLCEEWNEGQAASLRRGVAALSGERKVLVLLGDQPFVTPPVLESLAAEPPGSRAAYRGVPGHPAVVGPRLMALARTLSGDRGLRDLVRWRLVEVGDLASDHDLDTPDDLEVIRDEARARL